jgi:hypothetical protein
MSMILAVAVGPHIFDYFFLMFSQSRGARLTGMEAIVQKVETYTLDGCGISARAAGSKSVVIAWIARSSSAYSPNWALA